MNKVLALDPKAIEFDSDWVKIYPFVGHEKGLFMANFPKNWTKEFLNEVYEEEKWEFWDAEKIKEYLITLQKSNTFVSLNSPYEPSFEWHENFLKLDQIKIENCIAVCRRNVLCGLKNLDNLDSRQLFVDTTIGEKFSPNKLANVLKIFLQNSSKMAIVDRHNYLTAPSGKPSLFVEFVKEILDITKSTRCHEIIIYAKYDPLNYPYMLNDSTISEKLKELFDGCITPTYGIKYICCAEYQKNTDLHSRRIITNHVVFILSDSIAGRTYSQSITRVHDEKFRELNIRSWIDQDHGLDVKASAVYVNQIKT